MNDGDTPTKIVYKWNDIIFILKINEQTFFCLFNTQGLYWILERVNNVKIIWGQSVIKNRQLA